jgi:elongation factor Ts
LAEQAASVGENVQLRRLVRFDAPEGVVGSYIHAGSQIGVLVEVKATGDLGAAAEFARNVAMHIAASNPTYVSPSDIDADFTQKQRDIFLAQAMESGKPQNIVEKMVDGRVAKWQAEISLVKQPYVKEPDITVEQYQKKVGNVTLVRFARFQVGEGIEVQKTDLAAEVAAQLNR